MEIINHKGKHYLKTETGYREILASTDTSLRTQVFRKDGTPTSNYDFVLPQPSQSFIENFVEQYNLGNIITDVMVEYILNNEDFDDIIEKVWDDDYKLKINVKDNTINIKSITSDSEVIGEKIVEYCKQYEGTNKYNDVLEAIEFGYQLSIDKNL